MWSAYYQLNRHDEAVSVLGKAKKTIPNSVIILQFLGSSYHELGRMDEAIKVLKEAVKLDADNAFSYWSLGKTLADNFVECCKKSKKAPSQETFNEVMNEVIVSYKEAIRLDPDFADAHLYLGITYIGMGDMELALKEYKILKNLDNKLADVLFKVIYP